MEEGKVTIPVHKPGNREKTFFFMSGIVSSVPLTLFINDLSTFLLVNLPRAYAPIISTAVFAPIVEEFAKVYPLFYRHGETERSLFKLALLVGLGFGIFEMLTYVLILGVPWYIRLPGVFFHAGSASITAYGLAKRRPLIYYSIAVFLHFTNNFLAIYGPSTSIIPAAIVITTVLISYRLQTNLAEKIVL